MLLFKYLRVHQVFGANTDVGKTVITTALVRASAQQERKVFYLKPVSTGTLKDADNFHVKQYTASHQHLVHSECLFQYDDPVSPHLAAKLKGAKSPPSDDMFVTSIAHRIRTHAANTVAPAHMYIETAGANARTLSGVHSPALSGSSQADCYRQLFLPTILMADSRLGGISSTIASFESLLMRGYTIEAVLLFQNDYYKNDEYLKPYFADYGIPLATVNLPPPMLSDPSENYISTDSYYASITSEEEGNTGINGVIEHLDDCHSKRIHDLESMPQRALNSIWWPFVQHGLVHGDKDVTVIDSAYSDFLSIVNKDSFRDNSAQNSLLSPQYDGSASWWTQTVGHSHPSLTLAAAKASGRYGHVIFPQAVHLPALQLAERMINDGPGKGWASRAFFSDNGSTGMEVALKMALRAFAIRQGNLGVNDKKNLGILGLKGSYHGDTIGAMDACEKGVYTCEWHNAKGYWFDPPSVGISDGSVVINIPEGLAGFSSENIAAESLSWVYEVENRLNTPLAHEYFRYITDALDSLKQRGLTIAALVLEPIIMGAGGMVFVDPLFQRVLVDVVRGTKSGTSSEWSGLPVIFDEVFVGLHRIGVESTGPLLGIYPDISVNAKILTGGLVPMAVTLASKSIFDAFLSDNKADALLHGHSYTAHPIGCAVANETFAMIDKLVVSDNWISAKESWAKPDGKQSAVWSLWDPAFITAISKLPIVKETMTLGSVLAIKVRGDSAGYVSHSAQQLLISLNNTTQDNHISTAAPGGSPFGVHFRTLGDVAYFITSLNTKSSVIRSLEDKIWKTLKT